MDGQRTDAVCSPSCLKAGLSPAERTYTERDGHGAGSPGNSSDRFRIHIHEA